MITRTTQRDMARENWTADMVASVYGWEYKRSGYFDGWDLMFFREGRLRAIAEIKNREVSHNRYPDVFLSAHKWLTLMQASQGLGVDGLFIAAFEDQIRVIRVAEIDARKNSIAGRIDRPDAPNDQELIIHVPVSAMVLAYPPTSSADTGWGW